MASIFDDIEVQPSPFEIALQSIFLSGLQQRVQETGDLSAAVNEALGFKRNADGALVKLTDAERFDSLDPTQQNLFNRLKEQSERLERAFTGDLPVSERLKQRGEDQFRFLKEGRGRKGSAITGDTLESAQGFDTPTIQALGQVRRTQGLLVDEERRGEINTGFSNLFGGAGILQTSQQNDFTNRINAPARFDIGGFGGGLLAQSGAASRLNFGQETEQASALTGILGNIGESVLNKIISDERLKEEIKPLHDALDKVSKLNGVKYNWIEEPYNYIPGIGVIAQDVEKVYPELVKTNDKGIKEVFYPLLIPVLIEAIKTLKSKVEVLEEKEAV